MAIVLLESDCIVCSQVSCLLPLTLMNSCPSMDKMSSMPTAARTWGIWTPTSLLWQKKPTSRWPGKDHLSKKSSWEVRGRKKSFYFPFLLLLNGGSRIGETSLKQNQPRFYGISHHISSCVHLILVNLNLGLEGSGSLNLLPCVSNAVNA